MRKVSVLFVVLCVGLVVMLPSCKSDEKELVAPTVPDQTFVEEFDTVSSAVSRGWILENASDPKGTNVWQQGGSGSSNIPWFPAYSTKGAYTGFIGADFNSTSAGQGIISNWLISPVITIQNGDKISFYTRAYQFADADPNTGLPNGDSTDYGNRLQVLINTLNETANVGTGVERGSFEPLLDINPTYVFSSIKPGNMSPHAYPSQWTKFEVTVFGMNEPKRGRFAFRYFVEGGGPAGLGSGVGIDKVTYTSVNHK